MRQTTQSTNLRDIQSAIEPKYLAKNDTLEFNASWNVTPALTFYSDTGYNAISCGRREDYNRFDTSPGMFIPSRADHVALIRRPNGVFCDPQLGCSDRLVVQDLSTETCLAVQPGIPSGVEFRRPVQFQRRRQLSAL